MRRRRFLAALPAAAALGAAGPWSPRLQAATHAPELKVSVAVGPAFPLGKAAERWAGLLGEHAAQRFVTRLYPGATLADRDPGREFTALKEGRADLAVGSALQWSLQVGALAAFALPWQAPDDAALAALCAHEPLRTALAAKLDAAGAVLVELAPLGHRELVTRERVVKAPDDLRDLRIRAPASPLLHDTLLALGSRPQAMGFSEAQGAFANGTLDGQEGLPTSLAAQRLPALGLKRLTVWGAWADAMVFAVRKPVWEAWSAEQREVARRLARQAVQEADARAREDQALRELARSGLAVVQLTPAGHAAFRTAVADVLARWRSAVGTDIVALADAATRGGDGAAAAGAPSPGTDAAPGK